MIVKINETQYKWLFENTNLNEDLHYPKFLENFVDYVYLKIAKEIKQMLRQNIFQKTINLSLDNAFEYCDNIICVITLHQSNNIDKFELYGAKYYAEKFVNGKIDKPVLYLQIPFNEHKQFMLTYVRSIIFHELNHLYDDWIGIKNDKTPLSLDNKINHTMSVFNSYVLSDNSNPLSNSIAKISYLGIDSEKKAFATQVVVELERVGCNLDNFRQKYQETVPYKNYIKIKNELINNINNASEIDLRTFNSDIFDNYKSCLIPKFDYNNKKIKIEDYRKSLLKWANNVFHQFMLKFGGVLTYYLEELKKDRVKKGIIF